jgi:DNA-binding response OmpR family regulator
MSPIKVLLVEDDHTMLALLRTLLQLEGYQVAMLPQNSSLDDAVSFVRDENPALVLADVHLRSLNGFDLLQRLRQDEALARVQVLMTSGIDFSVRCESEGADGFILKPYMPEDLMMMIRKLLGRQPTLPRE